MKKTQCYEFETGEYDTAGRAVMARKCFCGTTACGMNQAVNYTITDKIFPPKDPDCDCPMEWTLVDPNNPCKKCQDRMNKHFSKLFGNNLI